MTHPPGTRLGSMRPGPTQPTRTGSHASAATHRQLEEAHLPRRSPHGKTEQGFPARETLTRGYSQRAECCPWTFTAVPSVKVIVQKG